MGETEREMSSSRIITSCILISPAGLMDTLPPLLLLLLLLCKKKKKKVHRVVSEMSKQRAFPHAVPLSQRS